MTIRQLDQNYAVSGQIEPADVQKIADMGYKSLVCNRPDGEAADQVPFERIAAAARAVGMRVEYLPIAAQGTNASDQAAFASLFNDLPKPVFAYCRSGNRSALLWSGMDAATVSAAS